MPLPARSVLLLLSSRRDPTGGVVTRPTLLCCARFVVHSQHSAVNHVPSDDCDRCNVIQLTVAVH